MDKWKKWFWMIVASVFVYVGGAWLLPKYVESFSWLRTTIVVLTIFPLIPIVLWKGLTNKLKLSWWLWEEMKLWSGEAELIVPHIMILGLFELYEVPAKQELILRRTFGSDYNKKIKIQNWQGVVYETRKGFRRLFPGWNIVIFPKIVWANEGWVDCRQNSNDFKQATFNTDTNPVTIDTTVVWEPDDPVAFAVQVKSNPVKIILEALYPAINYVTQGWKDLELYKMKKATLMREIADLASHIMNGDMSYSGDKVNDLLELKTLRGFGMRGAIRLENVRLMHEIEQAKASVETEKLTAESAGHLAEQIEKIRKSAGLPDKHWSNVVIPALTMMLAGKASTKFPGIGVSVDLGQVSRPQGKGGSEKKSEGGDKE
ncbi:hypothetical protein KKA15_04810 [Patescibacteria group bacterium]|nr:hypothetical protein [Patescibacteria group bacterium]